MTDSSWWLDASASLDCQFWALLDVRPDGVAIVTDMDGRRHSFADRHSAVLWLLEDEYESLAGLIASGEIPRTVVPPEPNAWRRASE